MKINTLLDRYTTTQQRTDYTSEAEHVIVCSTLYLENTTLFIIRELRKKVYICNLLAIVIHSRS